MRERLEELKFKFNDFAYEFSYRYTGKVEKVFSILFYLACIGWAVVCGILLYHLYQDKPNEITDIAINKHVDVSVSTLAESYKLEDEGKASQAFDLLATHYNKFIHEYDKSEQETLERRLTSLSKDAPPITLAELYESKDLVETQPIYTFTGIVSEVDEDAMYGLTHMVSESGERNLQQLEVVGLGDVSVGSKVTFVGVPTFDDVSTPIKVQAFVTPEEESYEP